MSGQRQTNEALPDNSGGSGIDMSVEGQARRLGWYPKEKFRGNPDDWIPADRFVERAHNELPVLKENLRRLDERYAAEETRSRSLMTQVTMLNNRLESIGEAFDNMRELSTKAEQRGYDRALASLKAQAKQAAEDGDAVAVERVMTETAELVANRVKADAPPPEGKDGKDKRTTERAPQRDASQVQTDPVAEAWAKSNERAWYRESQSMAGYANGLYEEMRVNPETKNLPTGEKLAKIDRAVQQAFPQYFNRNRPAPQRRDASVEEPREPAERDAGGNGRSFDDLPAKVKAQYEVTAREIKNRWGNKPNFKPYTKEEFIDAYLGPVKEEQ